MFLTRVLDAPAGRGLIGASTMATMPAPGDILTSNPVPFPWSGLALFAQGLVRDDASPQGFVAVTNGIEILIQ